jgi:hypothetical protein
MGIRANIIIKRDTRFLIFRRHSDGYPEGVAPSLNQFIDWLKSGKIRDNISQAAGWLVEVGRQEQMRDHTDITSSGYAWKIGHYEPDTHLSDDIEHAYLVDLEEKTWKEINLYEAAQIVFNLGSRILDLQEKLRWCLKYQSRKADAADCLGERTPKNEL